MNHKSDAELVEEVLSGATDSFGELVRRYQRPVYGLALSFVNDFDAAEDMAQEAFLAAYEQLRSLDQPHRFGNWLRIIAANRCRSYLRRKEPAGWWREALASEIADDRPGHVLSPEAAAARSEDRASQRQLEASTMSALEKLPPASRQALTLYYLGGQSTDRVARFLEISPAAVKMRMYRARKRLREEARKMVAETLDRGAAARDLDSRVKAVELTVLCAELSGLAPHVRGMNAIEEAEFLYEHHTDMTDIVLEHDGTIDSYDKGNIVAFFGDPVRRVDHAERACSAALEMWHRLRTNRGDETDLSIRCGLSTGLAVVGNMGSRHKADYRVAGEVVRLAGRLAHVERRLGAAIVLSEDTCGQVDGDFEVQELDRITFTGRDRPLKVFELLCRRGELDTETARALQAYRTGLEHYSRNEWAAAMACFTESGSEDLGYGFSRRYATRCWLHEQVPQFDLMTRLTDDEMHEVLRQVDQRDLLEAMREMDADYKELFLSRMSQRVRRWMEEQMEAIQLTAYSRQVVLDRYRGIVEIALRLAEEGKIKTDLA